MCVASAFAPQAWHLREAHDRTGGVVESYLGGRPNRFAPGLSGREQRGGVGVLRRSGEEVSTVGGCFSRRRSGPDVGTHEGCRAPRRHRRARGKRFDDVHERGRRRRAVRGGSHVEVRHAPPKDDGIDATRDDVRSKASPPSRRGARRARDGRTTARRAPRFEARDARVTSDVSREVPRVRVAFPDHNAARSSTRPALTVAVPSLAFSAAHRRSVDGTLSLPAEQWPAVQRIVPGTPLFLYDTVERTISGVYEAVRPRPAHLSPPLPSRAGSRRQKLATARAVARKWIRRGHFPVVSAIYLTSTQSRVCVNSRFRSPFSLT